MEADVRVTSERGPRATERKQPPKKSSKWILSEGPGRNADLPRPRYQISDLQNSLECICVVLSH